MQQTVFEKIIGKGTQCLKLCVNNVTNVTNVFNPFPSFDASAADDFFENIMTKGRIAKNEQFLLLPQCFQLFLVIIPTFIEVFRVFPWMFSKSSAVDLYVGKGKIFSPSMVLKTDESKSIKPGHRL